MGREPAAPIERTLSRAVGEASKRHPALLVTGPRQAGKTTLLRMCSEAEGAGRNVVNLDDIDARDLAGNDPKAFLERFPPPVVIDEIQHAPELMSQIKAVIDQERRPGLFWLAGSQSFPLMRGVKESLAGRMAVLDLLGLSQAELEGRASATAPFLPTPSWAARARGRRPVGAKELYRRIWLGGFPRLHALDQEPLEDLARERARFYNGYLRTHLQRDVRNILNVTNMNAFMAFLRSVAARTSLPLNYAALSSDTGADHKTVKAWMSVLEAMGLVHLLPPFRGSPAKRTVKTPKVHFLDTGLCCHLTKWPDPGTLEAGAMAGPILETWLFTEILKTWWHNGEDPALHHYRNKDGKEIDLVIDHGGLLHPVEFKKTATPSKTGVRSFAHLDGADGRRVGHGAVVCLAARDIPLSKDVLAIPAGYL